MNFLSVRTATIITRQPRYIDFDSIAARPLPRVQDSSGADNRSECDEEQDQRSFAVAGSSSVHAAPPGPTKRKVVREDIVIDDACMRARMIEILIRK